MKPELIIFDCDGVLIDSEIIVCRLVAEVLTNLGYPITTDDVIGRFAGRPEREMVADIEADWGQPIPPTFFAECKRRINEAYRSELRPIPGVRQVLDAIRIPICVASSAYPEKLRLGLASTGLDDRFGGNVISASVVARGKPEPDVFVYAAGWMQCPTFAAVVIEDSIAGVRAARRAGMQVLGFTGGRHCPPDHGGRLLEAGADLVFAKMSELPYLLPDAFEQLAMAS
jgi:HAD superfamily hydrolase (TIGR01509 family)